MTELERICAAKTVSLPEQATDIKNILATALTNAVDSHFKTSEKLELFQKNWKHLGKLLKKLPTAKVPKSCNISFELNYYAHRARGHAMMEFRSFQNAILYYKKAKKICEQYLRYKEKLLMY